MKSVPSPDAPKPPSSSAPSAAAFASWLTVYVFPFVSAMVPPPSPTVTAVKPLNVPPFSSGQNVPPSKFT